MLTASHTRWSGGMGYLWRGKWIRDEKFVSGRGEPSVGVWKYRSVIEKCWGWYVGLWSWRGCCQPWIWAGSRKQSGGNGTSPGYVGLGLLLNLRGSGQFPMIPKNLNSHKLTVKTTRGDRNSRGKRNRTTRETVTADCGKRVLWIFFYYDCTNPLFRFCTSTWPSWYQKLKY